VSITGFSSLKDFLGRHDTAKTPAWRYDIKASTTGPIVAKIVVHSHGAISDAEAVYTETVGSCRADNRASSRKADAVFRSCRTKTGGWEQPHSL
jgi:hypothetical protein